MFGTTGADGSVRMFDLRALQRSKIIYDGADNLKQPLLRIAWNKQDPNFLAVVSAKSQKVLILDQRIPLKPYAELNGHHGCVNGTCLAAVC